MSLEALEKLWNAKHKFRSRERADAESIARNADEREKYELGKVRFFMRTTIKSRTFNSLFKSFICAFYFFSCREISATLFVREVGVGLHGERLGRKFRADR